MISWMQTWLTDRRQSVIVEGEISNWKSVVSGSSVTGVGVGGLYYFLIFLNDLDDVVVGLLLFREKIGCALTLCQPGLLQRLV